MRSVLSALLLLGGAGLSATQSVAVTDLVGTWNSKANSTMTGSGFYDPVNDQFTEPKHTGISYSFTADGFFEEAYYRAVANPTTPKCPKGIMQFQHGTFTKEANGSLVLTPIAVDGRQLYSDPCAYKNSIYTRYNTSELFKSYQVVTDGYHKIPRLNLYKFDGSPVMPLYLAMSPPQMLPTTTLNPLSTASATSKSKVRRSFGGSKLDHPQLQRTPEMRAADTVWWLGVVLTASGGVLYWFF